MVRSPSSLQQHLERKVSIEDALAQLVTTQTQFMTKTEFALQSQAACIQNLEVQMEQLANAINTWPQNNLPSAMEVNPKEQCKAITVTSYLSVPIQNTFFFN